MALYILAIIAENIPKIVTKFKIIITLYITGDQCILASIKVKGHSLSKICKRCITDIVEEQLRFKTNTSTLQIVILFTIILESKMYYFGVQNLRFVLQTFCQLTGLELYYGL